MSGVVPSRLDPFLVICWRLSSLCRLFVVAVVSFLLFLFSQVLGNANLPVCISPSDSSSWTQTTSSTGPRRPHFPKVPAPRVVHSWPGGCRRLRVYVCRSSFGGLVAVFFSVLFSLMALHADISD